MTAATAAALTETPSRPLPAPPADGVDPEVLSGSKNAAAGVASSTAEGSARLLTVEIPDTVEDGTFTLAGDPGYRWADEPADSAGHTGELRT